jgi:hypothetical protein
MPGRLARYRHPREPLGRGPSRGPVQRSPEVPSPAAERSTGQHPQVVITHHHHLLAVRQIDPDNRVLVRDQLPQPSQPSVTVAAPRDTPLALPMNALLLRWDTKPDKRIRRTFLRPASTRRTSFYAACRAVGDSHGVLTAARSRTPHGSRGSRESPAWGSIESTAAMSKGMIWVGPGRTDMGIGDGRGDG